MSDESLVRNAADPEQVKAGKKREERIRRQQLDDVRSVLSTLQGRRFVWRLLEKASIFNSIWEQSARIHYNAGKQDFGHFLMGEVVQARDEALLEMMRESKENKYV